MAGRWKRKSGEKRSASREERRYRPSARKLVTEAPTNSFLLSVCNLVVEMPIYISFALWFSFPISIFHLSCSFDCGGGEETLAGWV